MPVAHARPSYSLAPCAWLWWQGSPGGGSVLDSITLSSLSMVFMIVTLNVIAFT